MEKNKPLVSVVMPVHNGEKYIREALQSCFDQTYKNIEIIVVDDKSTDSTLSILYSLEKDNPNMIVIQAEKQNGLGDVINIGVKKAKGKYIARLDADDVMYQDRLEKQVRFLEDNPDVVIVGGQIDTMDENGKITGSRTYSIADKDIKKNLFLFQPFAHPAVTMRKDSLEKIGLYPEGVWKIEDVMLFFKMSQVGQFANLPDTVIKYRMATGTQSQGDLVGHFKETEKARKWAIRELGLRPTIREKFWWFAEKVGVSMLYLLPQKVYIWVFHTVRKVLR
jgi:glycosyltransferase involved in cell wall biosynthesis